VIAMICLDDKNGYLFTKRRQSQDSVLRSWMIEKAKDSALWMNAYSQKQFEKQMSPVIKTDEEFGSKAGKGEYCFFENVSPSDFSDRIEKLILIKWNRVYPSDKKFTMDLSGFRLEKTEEFKGSSHDKITIEEYSI
jgi:hypothetical protein